MNSNENRVVFDCIKNFISDLVPIFGKKYRPLQRYNELLKRTTMLHKRAVERNIRIWSEFVITNREVIAENKENFKGTVKYSSKIFVDMKTIFNLNNDSEIAESIWDHIKMISALLDPEIDASEYIKSLKKTQNDNVPMNPLAAILGNLNLGGGTTEDGKEPSNPQELLQSLGGSNMISGLLGGLQSGDIDTTQIFSMFNSTISKLQESATTDDSKEAINEVSLLVKDMESGKPPDMSKLMGTVSGLMSKMQASEKVENVESVE